MGTLSQKEVAKLYVAMFHRAPEKEGLDAWYNASIENDWSFGELAQSMVVAAKNVVDSDPSYASIYPEYANLDTSSKDSVRDVISAVYEILFNKTYQDDPDGIDTWVNSVVDDKEPLGNAIASIVLASDQILNDPNYDSDTRDAAQAFENKVEVSLYAADKIETADVDGDGEIDFPEFQGFIKDVTEDPNTITAAETEIRDFVNGSYYSVIDTSFERVNYSAEVEVQALDSKYSWDKEVITYSFNEEVPDEYYDVNVDDNITEGFAPLSSAQRDAVRDTLKDVENTTNLEFVEVSDGGDIRFSNVDTGKWAGYGFYPTGTDIAGDVFLSNEFLNDDSNYSLEGGGYGKLVITHEIGHALGLKHPFEGDVTIPPDEDDSAHTVMSYTHKYVNNLNFEVSSDNSSITCSTVNVAPDSYSAYDLDTLQYKYGVNDNFNNTNTTYKYDFDNIGYTTIWDTGGSDTLDLSTTTGKDTVDLRGGSINSVDEKSLDELITYYQDKVSSPDFNDYIASSVTDCYNQDSLYFGKNNLGIASGVIIENIFTGSGNDVIIDNKVDNYISTAGGDDKIYISQGGLDVIDGGDGTDKVYINANISDIGVEQLGTNEFYLYNSGDKYAATLIGVEYVVDISGNEYSVSDLATA